MVEMPMRVDEMRDGIGCETDQRLGELRTRYTDAGVDKHFAIRARQNGNVPARAFEHADVISQFMRDDGRHGDAVLDQADNSPGLGEGFTRR
jgi:hypothetical protein